MSIFHDSALIGSGGGAVAYQINQSLRLDGSSYLQRTPSTETNIGTWTISCWHKRGRVADAQGYGIIVAENTPGDYTSWIRLQQNSDTFEFQTRQARTINHGTVYSNGAYRDPSAWYHYVFRCDTTQSDSANRFRIYVNGVQISTTVSVPLSQSYKTFFNQAVPHRIGTYWGPPSGDGMNGYLAEFHLIDGQSLDASSFGETDTITGAWIPKKYSGSYGTNGFYLKFDPSATNGIGHDHSGNGNNFTATGFSTSSSTYNINNDVVKDTPTNNHATWLPGKGGLIPGEAQAYPAYRENGNLYGNTGRNSPQNLQASIPFPDNAKTYVEVYYNDSNGGVGISLSFDNGKGPYIYGSGNYDLDTAVNWSGSTGNVENPRSVWTGSSSGGTFGVGDLIGVSVDTTGSTASVVFYKNGTQAASGTVAASAKSTLVLNVSPQTGSSTYVGAYINAGQYAFNSLPTGFKALSTGNLPEPTIKKGAAHFNTVLYTGTGSTLAVTGVGFQPDFIWFKNRSNAASSALVNQVTDAYLSSDLTDAESAATDLTYQSDGFTHTASSSRRNTSSQTYVAWNWKADNTNGSSNTAGSITSTVSANATAGFSIVTYTGAGSNGTVGHGLGVAPKFLIVKNRSSATAYNWYVWHTGLTSASYFLNLNRDIAQTFSADPFNGTAPTSTVFSVGGENRVSSVNYVAYCFSEVAGYSKFGSYVGNGSSDGPFVFTGMRPRWILVKASSTSGYSWICLDTQRDSYNVSNKALRQNLSDAELANTLSNTDLLSNGFKLKTTWADMNASGTTYIFAAFAEHPFKYANAR